MKQLKNCFGFSCGFQIKPNRLVWEKPSETGGPEKAAEKSPEKRDAKIEVEKLDDTVMERLALAKRSYRLGKYETKKGKKAPKDTTKLIVGSVDATQFEESKKKERWYKRTASYAAVMVGILDTDENRFNQKTLDFLKTKKDLLKVVAELKPSEFEDELEKKYSADEVWGAEGIYNVILAFQRIVNISGKSAKALAKDKNVKLVIHIGGDEKKQRYRYARAFGEEKLTTLEAVLGGSDVKKKEAAAGAPARERAPVPLGAALSGIPAAAPPTGPATLLGTGPAGVPGRAPALPGAIPATAGGAAPEILPLTQPGAPAAPAPLPEALNDLITEAQNQVIAMQLEFEALKVHLEDAITDAKTKIKNGELRTVDAIEKTSYRIRALDEAAKQLEARMRALAEKLRTAQFARAAELNPEDNRALSSVIQSLNDSANKLREYDQDLIKLQTDIAPMREQLREENYEARTAQHERDMADIQSGVDPMIATTKFENIITERECDSRLQEAGNWMKRDATLLFDINTTNRWLTVYKNSKSGAGELSQPEEQKIRQTFDRLLGVSSIASRYSKDLAVYQAGLLRRRAELALKDGRISLSDYFEPQLKTMEDDLPLLQKILASIEKNETTNKNEIQSAVRRVSDMVIVSRVLRQSYEEWLKYLLGAKSNNDALYKKNPAAADQIIRDSTANLVRSKKLEAELDGLYKKIVKVAPDRSALRGWSYEFEGVPVNEKPWAQLTAPERLQVEKRVKVKIQKIRDESRMHLEPPLAIDFDWQNLERNLPKIVSVLHMLDADQITNNALRIDTVDNVKNETVYFDFRKGKDAMIDSIKTSFARYHYKLGEDLYLSGKYRQCLNEFKLAYGFKKLPQLFFNIGQCYQQLGEVQNAAGWFRAYLEENPTAPDRTDIEKLIQKLDPSVAPAASGGAAPAAPLPGTAAATPAPKAAPAPAPGPPTDDPGFLDTTAPAPAAPAPVAPPAPAPEAPKPRKDFDLLIGQIIDELKPLIIRLKPGQDAYDWPKFIETLKTISSALKISGKATVDQIERIYFPNDHAEITIIFKFGERLVIKNIQNEPQVRLPIEQFLKPKKEDVIKQFSDLGRRYGSGIEIIIDPDNGNLNTPGHYAVRVAALGKALEKIKTESPDLLQTLHTIRLSEGLSGTTITVSGETNKFDVKIMLSLDAWGMATAIKELFKNPPVAPAPVAPTGGAAPSPAPSLPYQAPLETITEPDRQVTKEYADLKNLYGIEVRPEFKIDSAGTQAALHAGKNVGEALRILNDKDPESLAALREMADRLVVGVASSGNEKKVVSFVDKSGRNCFVSSDLTSGEMVDALRKEARINNFIRKIEEKYPTAKIIIPQNITADDIRIYSLALQNLDIALAALSPADQEKMKKISYVEIAESEAIGGVHLMRDNKYKIELRKYGISDDKLKEIKTRLDSEWPAP